MVICCDPLPGAVLRMVGTQGIFVESIKHPRTGAGQTHLSWTPALLSGCLMGRPSSGYSSHSSVAADVDQEAWGWTWMLHVFQLPGRTWAWSSKALTSESQFPRL